MLLQPATILLVDDQPFNLMVLTELLDKRYHILVAKSGAQALKLVMQKPQPDLILLDIMMPDMNGMEVCKRLKENEATKQIPVIFITAISDEFNEAQGLEMGAADYLTKPISPPIVNARVETQLKLRRAQLALTNQNQQLEQKVTDRTRELLQTRELTIFALATLAEYRDTATGQHIKRTQQYIQLLAQNLAKLRVFGDSLDDNLIAQVVSSAPLHDIGKIGIPDKILLKPGKLTKDEFNTMKTHTTLGCEAIMEAESLLQKPNTFLSTAAEIALNHHEKWDGSGYPNGLCGDQIPLSARLMAVADVYDALISERVYKKAFSHEKATDIIIADSGKHFDPKIIKVFKDIHPLFEAIA